MNKNILNKILLILKKYFSLNIVKQEDFSPEKYFLIMKIWIK